MREEDSFDLSTSPEVLRLAEEVHASGKPRTLRSNGEVLAVLLPFSGRGPRSLKKRELSAQDVDDFRAAAGSWSDIDVDQFMADVYTARDVPEERNPGLRLYQQP
jgi:hypothetical protein